MAETPHKPAPSSGGAPSWLFKIRGDVPFGPGFALGLVPVAIMLGLWWWATRGAVEERLISIQILPSPSEVIESISSLFVDRHAMHHVGVSLGRVGQSYLWALAIALPLGIAMASFGSIGAIFSPTSTASGYIPISTLVPLTIAWFGTGEQQKVIFLALAFLIYLLPAIVKAIDSVPDVYLRTASTLGATRMQTILRVMVPIAAPDIWHAMRLAFGIGWTYIVLAEAIVQDDGLGFLVTISQRRGHMDHVYLVIALITVIAWVADLAWRKLGHLLFRYQRSRA